MILKLSYDSNFRLHFNSMQDYSNSHQEPKFDGIPYK